MPSASRVRVRLQPIPGQPLELGGARLALLAVLWARSDKGKVVVSSSDEAFIDDLSWLGIEADEPGPEGLRERCQALAEQLCTAGKAYPCFCTPAELREMQTQQAVHRQRPHYDGRCRRLSDSDRLTLRKAGRKPSIRLRVPEGPVEVRDVHKKRHSTASGQLDDFRIVGADGEPTAPFAAVVDDRETDTSRALLAASQTVNLAQRALVARALDCKLPEIAVVADWLGSDGAPLEPGRHGPLTLAELRAAGFHPSAVMTTIAHAGWDPGKTSTVTGMAKAFKLGELAKKAPVFDMDALRATNGQILGALKAKDRISAVVEHLSRRGYPIRERSEEWKARFVEAVLPEMRTLADAEPMAALLLTTTVDYSRDAARVLRDGSTQELIERFEKSIKRIGSDDPDVWRDALSKFRRDSDAPGRALATLRIVLTGERDGPSLAELLALLGREGCKARLEKARRYSESGA